MLDPAAMGYDPRSEAGQRQRNNLAAALLTAVDSAPEHAKQALWIDGAQMALLWLREPATEWLEPCREMLAKVREAESMLAEDSDEGALANVARWVLGMIVMTRFGPAQVGANKLALRAVMNDAEYLAKTSGRLPHRLLARGRVRVRYFRRGGDLTALTWL